MIRFRLKQLIKMSLQNVILPVVYTFWRCVYAGKKPELILFADAHHESLPFSMVQIHEELIRRGYQATDVFCDYARQAPVQTALSAVRFMRLYVQARYVFICDNFLPVSSCRKRRDTTVIQLWHSCGLMKKMGYDTPDDIPAGYRGNVYRNYDLVTVSAPFCIGPLSRSMQQKPGVVQATGVSRTDLYYKEDWIRACRDRFYQTYPDARGKKIILWAPTFRGNAADPYLVGTEAIDRLSALLGDDCLVIQKVHPHLEQKYHLSNCPLPTEQLFPVTDLMITDYSSAFFDFLLFQKPVVLFAPDLEQYRKDRGFYSPYESLSPYVVTQADDLKDTIIRALHTDNAQWLRQRRQEHMASCDGCATKRILDQLGLL